jgi:gliding motility-associated-like protein
MKYCHIYILILLITIRPGITFSQVSCITDPPLPPVLTSVSVQPENGNTVFTWELSPSTDIAAYIVYSYKNGDGFTLDTIWDPAATTYTLSSTVTKYFSVSYVVAAMRKPRCTSIFSNVINSIYEKVSIDTCLKKVAISWNSYPSFPYKVSDYSVLTSVEGGNYTELSRVTSSESGFTLNDFTINKEYCFVVRANLEAGKVSTSNKTCVSTKMQRPPAWINADQATINENGKIALSFSIDPLSEIKHFSLERKNGSSGTFQEISMPVSVNSNVSYIDTKALPDVINYYRLSAVNNCNLPVLTSNLASNIVLSLERSYDNIILSWNPYKKWLGTVTSLKLFANTGKGFEEISDIPPNDTLFTLGYKQIMYQVTADKVCFFVRAAESSNPYGITGESISSQICTTPAEVITVPNVFTPNNDLKNDLFRPVLSFTPLKYHLIISDRHNRVLFETNDFLSEWDGMHNGTPEPEGVCLWFLKLTTPTGKSVSRTGTVTIIRSK